jgi:hypothetical protein
MRAVFAPRRTHVLALMTCLALVQTTAAWSQEPTFERGVDRPGFDYRDFTLPRPRARLCQQACLTDTRCRAWTFVDARVMGPVASCWLKDQTPQPKPNPCCVSGVVAR